MFVGDRVKLLIDNLGPSLLPGEPQADAYKLQKVLADSQWLDRHEMDEYQLEHLKALVRFTAREVPFWRSRLAADVIEDATTLADALARLPILSRDEVHDAGKALRPEHLPKGDAPAGTATSSGSSGLTVSVGMTEIARKWHRILDLRGYLWAGLDFTRSIAVIRRLRPGVAEYPDGVRNERWKDPSEIPFGTGACFHLSTHASLEEQWEWLKRMAPAYLYTRPSFVRGYSKLARDGELAFEKILTTGEVVDPDLRALAATKLKAEIHDRYASQETGCLAIQCPDANTYHVQSEAIIVEVVDHEGRPCKEGEIGRVLATPLFNFGGALIRYEIGDFAEVGGACDCGRSLPMLKRIAGRRRNMLVAKDGRRYWPQLHGLDFYNASQSRQHQFRQVAPGLLEVWLVVDSPRTQAHEDEMRRILSAALPERFEISFRYVDDIPRKVGDKQEELISLVDDPAAAQG